MYFARDFLKRMQGLWLNRVSDRMENRRLRLRPDGPVWAPRRKMANPFVTPDGRPLLVCIKGRNHSEMLQRGFHALGGLGRLGIAGSDVFIKPNLVGRESKPGFPNYPTMSSPECIEALIGILRDWTRSILVGDQGGENQTEIYSALGLDHIVSNAGGRLINFERIPDHLRRVRNNLWETSVQDCYVFSPLHEASLIFNLCNLKRHFRAGMTCALKNVVGAVEGRLSWGARRHLHRNPDMSEAFLRELAVPAALVNPEVTIVDALDIMVGNGPFLTNSGARIEHGVNLMVISGDMVAVDSYCAERILLKWDSGFNPESILPTLREAERLGLGTSDLSKVEILEIDGI